MTSLKSGLPQRESYSIAVDRRDQKVYFGTGRGIFLYEYADNETKLVSSPGLRVNMVFIDKDRNKYITNNPNGVEELYLLASNKKIRFGNFEDLNEMAIGRNNNFYYIKDEKLFVLKSNLLELLFIGDVSYGNFAQISFHINVIHENDSGSLMLVKNIPGKVTAIAFDHFGNFVLGMHGKILKYNSLTNKSDCHSIQK